MEVKAGSVLDAECFVVLSLLQRDGRSDFYEVLYFAKTLKILPT